MKRRVVVTGTGVISPSGDSPDALHRALCEGRSSLKPVSLFSTDNLGCHIGGEITNFSPEVYLGHRNFRPLDRISQLAAAAVQLTLTASGWSENARDARAAGIILGTLFSSVHTIGEFDRRALTRGPRAVSPLDFANTVINAASGQTAIWHGLQGINSTIATGVSSGLQALAYATDLIRNGRAVALVAGGVEELCFEGFYALDRAGLLHRSTPDEETLPVPFDAGRNGFVPGEGAAFLMLEEARAAVDRGAGILAEIRGYGRTYDSTRGRDPRRSIEARVRAIRLALEDAQITPDEIEGVSASANGSVSGDRLEAEAIGAVFGDRATPLPITAVKGVLGDALGASGPLQTVAFLEAMRSGRLPGIPWLESPEPGLPSALAGPKNQDVDLRCGLIHSFGFDGDCCVLVLARDA